MALQNLPSNPLEGIDLVIFDYDNTLYHSTNEYADAVNNAYGEYLVENKVCSTLEEASSAAKKVYTELGHTVFGFRKHGLTPEAFFQGVHQLIVHKGYKQLHLASSGFPPLLLGNISCKTVIFTQAERAYALEGIRHFGYGDYISTEDVYGLDTLGIHTDNMKHNEKSWKMIADKYGVPYERVAVVEDSSKYLKPPKVLGMRTVFVENNQYFNFNSQPIVGEHIDYSYKTTEDFLKAIPV